MHNRFNKPIVTPSIPLRNNYKKIKIMESIKIYIVSWILTLIQPMPCEPLNDEFGRPNTIVSSVSCTQTLSAPKTKEFTSKTNALAFYSKAKKEELEIENEIENDMESIRIWQDAYISDVKFDSIKKPINYIGL